ncbi:MAG TPA: hypothetical protein VFX50_12475, partial [Gemmatimonadales bacterium]|nr:hypothetical protein [Gemmatimonadales bacterium]
RSLESGSSAPAEAAARALGLCLLARGTISEGAARTIAFTGLDAGESDTAAYAAEREALLAVCVAEAHAGEDRRLDAMGMLRRARHALGRIEEPGPPAVYAAMLVARAEAELAEAGRDRMGAAQAFAECVAHAGTLLDRAADTEAIEGPLAGDVPERLVGTVERDAVHARVAGLLGRVRALVPAIGGGRGTASAEAAAHAVVAAIEAHGVPAGVAPLDIVETVIALTPADAALFARHVLRWVEGTSPGPARDWEAVLYAARAHGAMLRGDGEAGAALYERAGAVADDDVTPTVAAFVRGLDLLDNGDAEEELRAVIAEEFLIALSELANAEYGAAERPDARAEVLLEAPVAAAIAHVA